MTIVGGQQAAVQPEPLLTEMLCDHLGQFEVDVVYVSGQLVDVFLFFEQVLWLSCIYSEFFGQRWHAFL